MASSFYAGSKSKRPATQGLSHERLAKRLAAAERFSKADERRAPSASAKSSQSLKQLLAPPHTWRFFSRQQAAIDCAKNDRQNLHVFSFEDPSLGGNGRRRFLVSSYHHFFQRYKRMKKGERLFYEVIPEGCVCRLYFDLEYATACNPTQDGDRCVDIFIQVVALYLWREFGVRCSRPDVLDLESSTAVKFSRHLLFHLTDCCFQNNVEAGHFVQFLCRDLLQHIRLSKPLNSQLTADVLQTLLIKKADGSDDLFCDQGVYTRNRNFRLMGSCKLGKNAFLKPSATNEFRYLDTGGGADPLNVHLEERRDSHCYHLYLSSLVCALSFSSHSDVRVLTFSSGGQQSKMLDFTGLTAARNDGKASVLSSKPGEGSAPAIQSASYSSSPFPDVDRFILGVLPRRGNCGVPGTIRRWFYFSDGKTLTYDILGNRWCENISRQHKSNNIMMVVDLVAGTYYQKCHDPDCRQVGYRSPELPLPTQLRPNPPDAEGQQAADVATETDPLADELTGEELEQVLEFLDVTDVVTDQLSQDIFTTDACFQPSSPDAPDRGETCQGPSDRDALLEISILSDDLAYDTLFKDDDGSDIGVAKGEPSRCDTVPSSPRKHADSPAVRAVAAAAAAAAAGVVAMAPGDANGSTDDFDGVDLDDESYLALSLDDDACNEAIAPSLPSPTSHQNDRFCADSAVSGPVDPSKGSLPRSDAVLSEGSSPLDHVPCSHGLDSARRSASSAGAGSTGLPAVSNAVSADAASSDDGVVLADRDCDLSDVRESQLFD